MLAKKILSITGLHCQSCKTLIETELDLLKGISKAEVDFANSSLSLEFDDEMVSLNTIKKEIEKLNHNLSEETSDVTKKDSGLFIPKKIIGAGAFLLFLVAGYFLIDRLGLLELLAKLNEDSVSIYLIILVGFLASFHCIGMCGGLVITYSANEKQKKNIFSSHFQYNLGRFISYTLIGALLGGFGSFFAINPAFTGILVITAGVFMILMGISLLSQHQILNKIKIKTPQVIAKFLYNNKHSKKPKGPLVIGLLTGFMPCGPLQAIQLFALSTGSIISGALAMGAYALGTIPLMLGFGSMISFASQNRAKQIMKLSGIIVIVLGIFMANRGLANFGYGLPSLASKNNISESENITNTNDFQEVKMDLTYNGYSPSVLYIKKEAPVRWIINVKQMSGCTNAIMIESLGIKKDLKLGENIIEFTPPDNVSEIKFSCWMKMVWGKFIITDNNVSLGSTAEAEASTLPQAACNGNCGSSSCTASNGGSCGCSR